MPAGKDDVLHRVRFCKAEPGVYWHVFPARYKATASNPNSGARLAWRDGAHSMLYTGETAACALWESALRYAAVDNGYVYTDPDNLKGMMMARLTLTAPIEALDLRAPRRREIVDPSSDLDKLWEWVLREPDHSKTHDVTARLMSQIAISGHSVVPALIWHSRQSGRDTATLFFDPPSGESLWSCGADDVFPLDGPDGDRHIATALEPDGLKWRAAPSGAAFNPPIGIK
ncbi:RES family NAD+ phosphorylase [Caballeronia sordidicola]|uniref:RES family NAD+ phosphorylase n=1 Tax=Caballeronia sordidicola TaxID=196367 RepID=UPI0004D031A2|nr:RES family NAD+ phosphorylase [Caballeronia sordidicola]